jgi:hypothetical protein
VAYTVNNYAPTFGARKNQVTANLNLHFGVVLCEAKVVVEEASDDEEKDAEDE